MTPAQSGEESSCCSLNVRWIILFQLRAPVCDRLPCCRLLQWRFRTKGLMSRSQHLMSQSRLASAPLPNQLVPTSPH